MAKKITAISVYTKDGGWSTPYPIGSTVKEASATIAGILKAYTSTGSNTDGTMTQAAITQALNSSESVEITATWSTTTTTLTGDDGVYYSKSVTMSAGHGDHPTIMLIPGGSNTVPSAAQREAFNDVDFIVANDTALTLYSKVKINTPFVICVKN